MLERLVCHYCDTSFGQEKRFLEHLETSHNVEDVEAEYVKVKCDNKPSTCQCSDTCEAKLIWQGWKKGYTSKFVRGHNARIMNAFSDPIIRKKIAETKRQNPSTSWNKGLSKETDDRVLRSSTKTSATYQQKIAAGENLDWRVNDPEKGKRAAEKISQTKKKQYENNELVVWNKGLTKSTSEALAKISFNISSTVKSNQNSSSKRFKPDDLRRLIEQATSDSTLSLVTNVEDYRNRFQRLEFACSKCGKTQVKSLSMIIATPKCFTCFPRESTGQIEVFNFVKSICPDAIMSDRSRISPLELDVYVPSKNIGFEYDGLYWHSEATNPTNGALKKQQASDKAGVNLLRIFEDEWRDKRQIVESMIIHRLGKSRKIHGRKCKVIELNHSARKKFFDETHIDGDVLATKAWGLMYCDSIVAAISVRTPLMTTSKKQFEIARFSLALETSVTGALSKLTKVAFDWCKSKQRESLVTYVDKRIGNGLGYIAAGYRQIDATQPRFWWTDFHDRFDRLKYKADASRNMSQEQVASEANVVRIFGCQNLKLVYDGT